MGPLIIALGAGLYVLSFWLHPLRACPSCKGTPRKYGLFHTSNFRWCSRCEGRARVPRPGAVVLVKMGLMKNPERTGSLAWWWRNRRARR
jgi:hypothetical protein